jgi:hypothetical protein
MKLILALMCGLVILFAGGCALVVFGFSASSGTPGTNSWVLLGTLPAAVALLNLFVVGGLYGWGLTWRPAFYILGVIDLLIAAVGLLPLIAVGVNYNGMSNALALVHVVLFGLKGILTLRYARQGAA